MNAATLYVVMVRENALPETMMVFQDRTKAEAWCVLWAGDGSAFPGPAMEEVGEAAWRQFFAEPWTCDWWDDSVGIDFFIDIYEVDLSDPDGVGEVADD